MFENNIVLTALVPKKYAVLPAVSINLDQRALEGVSVRCNNDSPAYRIHYYTMNNTNRKFVSSREQVQTNAPSSMVDDTDERSKSTDDLEKVYDRRRNLESIGSDSIEGDNTSVH